MVKTDPTANTGFSDSGFSDYPGNAIPNENLSAGYGTDTAVPETAFGDSIPVTGAASPSYTPPASLTEEQRIAMVAGGANRDMIDAANVSYGAPAPKSTGFDLASITPTWSSIGGVRAVHLGAGLDLDFENTDYTLQQTRGADGTVVSKVVEAPENAKELGMSLIKKYDPETGNATYSKPEESVAQSLYKSPQFMAPVTASVVNGLFQMIAAERMAKAQRDEQRRMLDAQFQVLEKKEEANEEKKRRFASIYASLQAERKGKGRSG